MTGLIVLVATLVVATVAGLTVRRRTGQLRSVPGTPAAAPTATVDAAHADDAGHPRGLAPSLAALGVVPGETATLLQFSSTFCTPCRATRTLLADVASGATGVRHVEIDVGSGDAALDLVRTLDIRRTPTTLVLDGNAREVGRAAGVPRRDQVLAALDATAGS